MPLLRAIAITLVFFTPLGRADAIDLAGTVADLQGSAQATSTAGLSRPLRIGSTILVGDKLSTRTSTRLLLHMTDGAALALGDNTDIKVEAYENREGGGRAVLELVQGALLAKSGSIALSGPDRFTVSTSAAVVHIRGSEMWAELFPDRLALALLSGEAVTATTPQGSVELTPAGTGVDIVQGEPPPSPTHWGSERLENARRAFGFE